MTTLSVIARRVLRLIAVFLLVTLASTYLVRLAPGYLSDAREMDARFAGSARAQVAVEAYRSRSISSMVGREVIGWLHRDLGISRQYDVPVVDLVKPRLAVTSSLLLRSILLGWLTAGIAAILAATHRRPLRFVSVPFTLLLALPGAALATFCLILNSGGPVLVMTLLLAARDYRFLERLVSSCWRSPHLEYARALGVRRTHLLLRHVLPTLAPQFLALATLSLLTALSIVIPVEVIFSIPGVGQLGWSAALNRDYPVLLCITILMACAVTLCGLVSAPTEFDRQVRA